MRTKRKIGWRNNGQERVWTIASISISVVLMIMLTYGFASAQSTSEEYKPYLHKASVGDVPKLETFGEYSTELFVGAGTYNYQIIVPRGVNDMQPSVSLFYNSQSALQRPGTLGSGWSLSENYVMRNVNHTVDDVSDDYFVLALGGTRLKVLFNGTQWKSEINPAHYRIQNLSNAGNMYWLVTTTDGTKYRFGFNDDSLLESNTGKDYELRWSLDLIQDVHNNSVFYSYLKNPFAGDVGAVYLSNITYNNDRLRKIVFDYESQARPDRRLVFEQGNMLDESRRLSEITVYANNSLVRKYTFGYLHTQEDSKSVSALADITYIGADGISVLNTIRFDYYETVKGFDNSTGKWIVPEGFAFSATDTTKKDFGVRLIDVNNDGFPDLVKAKSGTRETRLNNKVDGWNSTSHFITPFDIVDSNNIDQGVRFADVNGDGLIDLLKGKGGTRQVYINNGTGWYADANWNLPVDFIDGSGNDLGVELVDLNGNGRVDILRAQAPSTKAAWINNGTGWESSSSWVVPDFFTTSDNKDNGLRILDLNGDGLPDLIKGGQPGGAWINNGTGWMNSSGFAPNLNFVDHPNRPDLGVRFMDINGDGLVDILQNFFSNVSIINQTCMDQNGTNCTIGQNITFASDTKLNNGTGWVQAVGWNSTERFTDRGYNIGRRIADVNGDGYADIVVAYQQSPYLGLTYIKEENRAFLLKSVTNAYGGVTEIEYTQSTLNDNGNDLGFNIWLVNGTLMDNALSGEFAAGSLYSYLYSGGKYDYISQEFKGFAKVNETLPDNSVISHFYHQDDVLKGREFRTSIYDSSEKLMAENFNVYVSPNNMVLLSQTSTQIYDGELTPVVNNISFEYDSYGNVREINNLGKVDISGDEKFEKFEYVYNLGNYVVDRPANYTLLASDGTTVVSRTSYFYDNLAPGITKGDLTKVRRYNNAGSDPESLYAYDSFGNVIKETQPLGFNSTFNYDATGTFRIKETNQKGHTINYVYDFGTGNLLSEIRHGLSKTFTYDTFGRIRTEIISPDTTGSPTKNYTYLLDGTAPEIIKIQSKNDLGYSEVLYFYDGFSNPVQIKTLFEGKQIVKNYFYDEKYRIKEEQNPYFDSYSTSLSAVSTEPLIRYEYDALDRVVELTKQDNTSITVVFNRTTVSQFDENGNRIDYTLDGLDRIKKVLEYNDGEVYNTTYEYRTDNNLLKITDTKGNDFVFGYDSLGRKTVYDDPNMNNWTYAYDLNGNLVNQTDGRGITTYLTYDGLNRIVLKKAGASNITFVYDAQFNGTLSNISTRGNYFKDVHNRYIYDSRLRVIEERIYLCYTEAFGPGSRCDWIDVSVSYDSQDRILNMHLPADTLNYEYNEIGKLKNASGLLNNVNYNSFGKIANKTYANNLITRYHYDELGRIDNLQTGALQNLSYLYDNVGNVKEINDLKNSKKYLMEYDELNRMTSADISNSSRFENFTYVYDETGNILGTIYRENNVLNPGSGEIITIVTNYTYNGLAHAPVEQMIARPLYVNVTVCGTLKYPNTIYLIQSDIIANNPCFIVGAHNITIEGLKHTIYGNDSLNTIGIDAHDKDYLTVRNLTVRDFGTGINFQSSSGSYISIFDVNSISNVGDGIWIHSGIERHILHNVNASYNRFNGIYFYGIAAQPRAAELINIIASNNLGDGINIAQYGASGSEYTLTNLVANGNGGNGVDIWGARRTVIENLIADGNGAAGLKISDSSFSSILHSNVSSVSLTGDPSINVTFMDSLYHTESVAAGHSLIRKWYLDAQVKDSQGISVYQANVTGYNVLGVVMFSTLTNTGGFITTQELAEYTNAGGTRIYQTNYTINASKADYSSTREFVNLTANKSLVFTLHSLAEPPILIRVITPNASNVNVTRNEFFNVTVNVTCIQTHCGNINIGFDPIVQTFNDSSSAKNFTGPGKWSNLTYIRLPKNATIFSASLDITGYRDGGSNYPLNVTLDVANDGDLEYSKMQVPTSLILQEAESENLEDTYNFLGSLLQFGSIDTLRSGANSAGWNISHVFLKFKMPSEIESIISSKLYLYFYGAEGSSAFLGNNIMSVFRLNNQTWTENCYGSPLPGQICPFSNIGSTLDSFTVTTRIPNNNPRWVNYDVTAGVSEALGGSTVSFALNSTNPSSGALYKFYSKEYPADSTKRPYLNITYISSGLSTTVQVSDFRSEVSDYLSTCSPDANGYCNVPLNISGFKGIVQLSNLVIDYFPDKIKFGLISTMAGDTPFYTNQSNPRTINLDMGQSQVVTAWINATGKENTTHIHSLYMLTKQQFLMRMLAPRNGTLQLREAS